MQEIIVNSKPIAIGDLIGKGGEGEVFALNGRSDVVVKIYASNLRVEREEKVSTMVNEGFATHTDFVAYPKEVVFDRRGNFLGFLMQFVSGYRPIHELYSPKSRQRYFAKAGYSFIIRAALNVARAVGKVHQSGCVIGDLNHSGILVSQDAKVALIDADSFQFRLAQKTYPCVVGVPDFTPPELHGVNLATVVRTEKHDNFGLAVAIFHLLFMGRHPYAGQHKGPDLSIGQAIAQNRFAYSLARRSLTGVRPPPGAPTLDVFPSSIQDAFESAFGLNFNARPDALDWVKALTTLEACLNRCKEVKTHYYPSGTTVCLWCDLSRNGGGFDMFPDVSMAPSDSPSDTVATEQAIQEILAFKFPVVADLVPKSMVSMRMSSRKLKAAMRLKSNRVLIGLLMMAGSAVGVFFAPVFIFWWLILGGLGVFFLRKRKVDANPFRTAFAKADAALVRELDTFIRRNGLSAVAKVRGDLDAAIPAYQNIDADLRQELNKLKSTRVERQRTAFLDRYSIRNAKISGIGPARTAMLVSFGIETAADISWSAMIKVPGIGDVMTKNLLDWRSQFERRFRYNPVRSEQDVADENGVRAQFAMRKIRLEKMIQNGKIILRSAKPKIDALPMKAQSDQTLIPVLENWLRAAFDLKLMGETAPNSDIKSKEVLRSQARTRRPKSAHAVHSVPSGSNVFQSAPNCSRCGSLMQRRSGKYGVFWGCSRYPGCTGTRNI